MISLCKNSLSDLKQSTIKNADYIPVVSTVKSIFLFYNAIAHREPSAPKKNPLYAQRRKITPKEQEPFNLFRTLILLIPLVGNLIVYVSERYNFGPFLEETPDRRFQALKAASKNGTLMSTTLLATSSKAVGGLDNLITLMRNLVEKKPDTLLSLKKHPELQKEEFYKLTELALDHGFNSQQIVNITPEDVGALTPFFKLLKKCLEKGLSRENFISVLKDSVKTGERANKDSNKFFQLLEFAIRRDPRMVLKFSDLSDIINTKGLIQCFKWAIDVDPSITPALARLNIDSNIFRECFLYAIKKGFVADKQIAKYNFGPKEYFLLVLEAIVKASPASLDWMKKLLTLDSNYRLTFEDFLKLTKIVKTDHREALTFCRQAAVDMKISIPVGFQESLWESFRIKGVISPSSR